MTIQTRSKANKIPNEAPRTPESRPPPSPGPEDDTEGHDSDYDEDKEAGGNSGEENSEEEDTEEEEIDIEWPATDGEQSDHARSQNAQNASSQRWKPWQDRILVTQIDADRPFLHRKAAERKAAWNATANTVNASLAKSAKNTVVSRTGEACRVRFNLLMKKFKSDEARSLQKTGTDEEVNEFIQILGDLCALADAENVTTARKTKHKADLQNTSGLQLRNAAMNSLVKRETLVDVASLDDASVRERQGQRTRKRKHPDDKENLSQNANAVNKRRKKARMGFEDILNTRLEADREALEFSRKQDQDRHKEQMTVLHAVADGLRGLRDEQERTNQMLRQQELDRREQEIRRREKELNITE
ncbi:hypothetical protein K438DRAFT_1962971 [Mycena galopus ATCC 62051]|nr:hypothetical protein K438DRAFT_1962971 [Mycena galopus ATCC 62051]